VTVADSHAVFAKEQEKSIRPVKPFPETPYASGFPVKPIILGKIIGFGLSGFQETGAAP
jgi:hypothetical protein